ncbi:TRAF family member-associated NF-kappa-B activator isoform X2 [Electrophorus electricus]|uniref:TRAF family member-associated NF-kappa-B activator isoform X2 n=1 Tax=Electrophorus electricus TaxID=8005 RepID=UPI0015CFDCDF|nr:TRAF family member-associated NF-kappa-B activator isoform X2 [Electrophorus electricus]
MDRDIGDKLNKAFEAYRSASIEKDSAKRELQQKTEQFERYTQQLKRKIEEQEQLISELKAQLNSAAQNASGEVKCCEVAHRKQETERLSSSDHWPGNSCPFIRTNHALDVMECAPLVSPGLPGVSGMKTEDVLDTLQEIQGTFQRIQTLTRRQKDHLKRIHKGNDTANDQQFSMPIQCTDDTPEHAEAPFSSSRPEINDHLTSGALASRGVSPEDTDFMDDVRFPPSTDSEYEFLNSTPDRTVALVLPRKGLAEPLSTETEGSLPLYPASPSASPEPPVSTSHEGVRGPQRVRGTSASAWVLIHEPLWSPNLSTIASEESSVDSAEPTSPRPCAFCKATVPLDLLYSHLNSHFQGE